MAEEGGSVTYCVEYAKSGKATCKGTCKSLIAKDAIRFGTVASRDGHPSTHWRCFPKCMTARVAHNAIEKHGDAASIPGVSDLKPEVKASVVHQMGALMTEKPAAEKKPRGGGKKASAADVKSAESGHEAVPEKAAAEAHVHAKPAARKPAANQPAAGQKRKATKKDEAEAQPEAAAQPAAEHEAKEGKEKPAGKGAVRGRGKKAEPVAPAPAASTAVPAAAVPESVEGEEKEVVEEVKAMAQEVEKEQEEREVAEEAEVMAKEVGRGDEGSAEVKEPAAKKRAGAKAGAAKAEKAEKPSKAPAKPRGNKKTAAQPMEAE